MKHLPKIVAITLLACSATTFADTTRHQGIQPGAAPMESFSLTYEKVHGEKIRGDNTPAADKHHGKWIDLISIGGGITKPNQPSRLYQQALKTQKTRFNANKQAVDKKEVDPKIIAIANKGDQLMKKVINTQGNMTPMQEKNFDTQMYSLIQQMDQASPGAFASTNVADGPAACMLECDAAYPGLGGGNGWNRFWCKSACLKIKINVGPGGGGVGG